MVGRRTADAVLVPPYVPFAEYKHGCLCIAAAMICIFAFTAADWPAFRGGSKFSNSAEQNVPVKLDSAEALAWKVELPGKGHSSPIVVGGRVIVTCSSGPKEQRLHVLCFDAKDGKQLWERQFWATGRTICHPTSAVAAPTPATDGKRIFAFYASNDLACLDLDGNLLWYRGLTYDFPAAFNDVGMASSPLVVNGSVIVQIESQGDSFAAGLKAETGETLWRRDRPREMNWCSPAVYRGDHADKELVLLQAPSGLSAVDPKTGEPQWQYPVKSNDITSAAVENGVVYLPSEGITAVQPDGGSSAAKAVWKASRLNPGAASPVVHDGKVYVVNRAGVLTCAETGKGEIAWQLRLTGKFWATPVIAAGHMYLFSDDGQAQVVSLGDKGELASSFWLGEAVMASPAVADGAIFVRSANHLWKFGGGEKSKN